MTFHERVSVILVWVAGLLVFVGGVVGYWLDLAGFGLTCWVLAAVALGLAEDFASRVRW
jgi:hypothetical protein